MNIYKVNLIKLHSIHKHLRTDEVEGECEFLPIVGERFEMTAKPLDPEMNIRLISTSPVISGQYHYDGYYFKTNNSSYKLEILAECPF